MSGVHSGTQTANLGGFDNPANGGADTGIDGNGFVDSILNASIKQFTDAIERLADMRAENGAEQNRVMNSIELLQTNMTNLEAAHGRIMDADIALESTRFARHNDARPSKRCNDGSGQSVDQRRSPASRITTKKTLLMGVVPITKTTKVARKLPHYNQGRSNYANRSKQ